MKKASVRGLEVVRDMAPGMMHDLHGHSTHKTLPHRLHHWISNKSFLQRTVLDRQLSIFSFEVHWQCVHTQYHEVVNCLHVQIMLV